MNREQSAYLDLLRLAAALTVFLGHISSRRLSGGFLWQLEPLGHDAVIVFFVLSGFVIQYVVVNKERTFCDYSIARFGRLYSVVIPALLLTLFCDEVGTHFNPHVYDMERESSPLLRLSASALFLSRSWGWRIDTLSNEPFWSLPYEFWYYQIFAAAYYFKGFQRVAFCAAAALIAGPNILGFFPIWLFGAVACRASTAVVVGARAARVVWTLSAVGLLGVALCELRGRVTRYYGGFFPDFFSPLDLFAGALVSVNIFVASYIRLPLTRFAKPIAACAGTTFGLYLFHMPLLHLAAAFVPAHWPAAVRGLIIGSFAVTVAVALSLVTEHRKKEWRSFFQDLLQRLSGAAAG